MNILSDLQTALPEALLAGFGLVALLLGAAGGDKSSGFIRLLSVTALGAAAVLTFVQLPAGDAVAFSGLYRVTPFVLFAKGATYALAAFALFMSGGFISKSAMERR